MSSDEQKRETLEEMLERYVSEETYSFENFTKLEVNSRGHEDWTLLHMVILREAVEDVETLIAAGADVNAKSDRGVTPLDLAISVGNLYTIKMLLTAGARILDENSTRGTPLSQSEGKPEIHALLQKLVSEGHP